MEESVFNDLAEVELAHIEAVLESCDAELDIELQAGGVLEVEFENGSKMIINRHAAAREIWVAAKSGGFHFRPDQGRWIASRDGAELYVTLSQLVSQQSGTAITLAPR